MTPTQHRLPQILCWKCDTPLTSTKMHAELTLARSADNHAIAAQREFKGICPTHGAVGGRVMGHHSTLSEARMKRRFPKQQWDRIKSGLDPAERRRFTTALHGQYLPSHNDIARWLRLAQS